MSDTALAVVETQALADVSRVDLATFRTQLLPSEFVARYLNAGAIPPEGLEEEIRHCYLQMQQTKLNPLLRQIHFIPRFDKKAGRHKLTAVTGIDGYRLLAERTGERDGEEPPQWCGRDGRWRDCWADSSPPVAARVAVYRRGYAKPFWGVCHLTEYAADTSLWRSMPAQMLAKCAEAMAIRKAFPLETAGLYTDAEMDQALSPRARRTSREQVVEGELVATAEVAAEGPEPAPDDHPGRKALAEQMSARFAGDKLAANKWLRSHSGGRSWKQLTAEDLHLLLDQVETVAHADQAETPAEAPADEPANQDAEARRRKAAQKAWGIAAGKCGLSEAEVYWYMGSAFGWVTDPDKGRPSANATPIPQIETAIHALNSLTPDEVDKVRQDYAFWLDDQNHTGGAEQ